MRRLIVIAIPYLWLLALFLIPFVIVLKIALSDTALARPPYLPQIDFTAGWQGSRTRGCPASPNILAALGPAPRFARCRAQRV